MIFLRGFQFLSILLILVSITFAQVKSDAELKVNNEKLLELKKAWLERVTTDVPNLKLPENRAIVYARLGKLYWKVDPDRANLLFRTSIDELLKAQKEAENDRTSPTRNDLLMSGETRRKILEIIISKDEEVGFALLIKSRSDTVIRALAGESLESSNSFYNGMPFGKFVAFQENTLEQQLSLPGVSSNPSRTINLLRRNSSGNITGITFLLLKSLSVKEKETANKITLEIINRVLATDFTTNSAEFQFASQVLSEAAQGNTNLNNLQLEPKTLHDLAEKVADFLIKEANKNGTFSYTWLTPILVKFVPERASELNEKTVPPRRSVFDIFPMSKEGHDFLQNNTVPEKLLAEADKFPAGIREQIYVKATNQIAFDGDIDRAKEILAKNFPKERLSDMYGSLYYQLAYRATEKGEYDNAFQLIELSSEQIRYQAYINLATMIRSKSPNEKQKAILALNKARALFSPVPTTRNEFTKMGELAAAYGYVEPETGFQMLAILIRKFIEVADAGSIVDNFQGGSNIRKNEFLINTGFRGLAELNLPLSNFTKADFERTIKIMNKIERSELRIGMELQILENE